MTQDGRSVVSVRGEARRTVPPDSATLSAAVSVTRTDREEALREAGAVLTGLTSRLAALGGTLLTPGTRLDPLTWSAQTSVRVERTHDMATGRIITTGQVTARVSVTATVRAFELLLAAADVLASTAGVELQAVGWDTDADNAAWTQLRAEAVRAAVAKAADYAAALGGTVVGVEHLGDPGLLGGIAVPMGLARSARTTMESGGMDGLALDPVPQELVAAVDARFVVTGLRVGPA